LTIHSRAVNVRKRREYRKITGRVSVKASCLKASGGKPESQQTITKINAGRVAK
jgi:hypothetical protein